MRVLLISHTCQSATEGQPKAEWLARLGVDLRVVVPDRWRHYGKWRVPDVPHVPAFSYDVHRVRWPWVGPAQFYLHWYPQLARAIESFRPDVIDLWEEPWGLVSAHACRLRNRLLPTAKIVSETEQNIDKRLPFPFEPFRAYTLQNADYAVGRNSEAIQILRSRGFSRPAEVVPNGVDAELFRPMDRAACRAELGFGGFVIGYVGRLVEEKGLTDLLDALPDCPPSVNLVYVGNGPLRGLLERRALEFGQQRRVRFIDAMPLRQLPRVMNALDAFILPSRTTARWKEQFGRVIVEAQACRTPVIGTRSGAIPDVVGEAGLLVAERDPVAIAAAVCQLVGRPELRQAIAERGRQQVERSCTWQRVAERMRDIYERVTTADVPGVDETPT